LVAKNSDIADSESVGISWPRSVREERTCSAAVWTYVRRVAGLGVDFPARTLLTQPTAKPVRPMDFTDAEIAQNWQDGATVRREGRSVRLPKRCARNVLANSVT
jgi:hypothetical protein